MDPYRIYGRFYDATQGTPDGAQYLYLLRKHHPEAKTLLEIACGTGAHLAPLAKHYTVEGLDISKTMLGYARRKLPDIRFHRQNMAGFELDATFDAIVCPYDSINHLLKFKDWVHTFKAVKRHLNKKGVFIFDVNTEYRLRELASAPPWVRGFGENYLIMRVSMPSNGISDWDIKVFEHVRPRTYRLHHEVIQERGFPHDRVAQALRRYFNRVHTYDRAGWSRPKATSQRLFYVCH